MISWAQITGHGENSTLWSTVEQYSRQINTLQIINRSKTDLPMTPFLYYWRTCCIMTESGRQWRTSESNMLQKQKALEFPELKICNLNWRRSQNSIRNNDNHLSGHWKALKVVLVIDFTSNFQPQSECRWNSNFQYQSSN